MIYAVNNINNHWNAFAYTDLPCNDSINTVDKAIKCKTDRGYTSPVEVTNYPKAYNKGKNLSFKRFKVSCCSKGR